MPDLWLEQQAQQQGHQRIAGIDEAGRGPLAGPVVAAAVILPMTPALWQANLNDSKKLTAAAREQLYHHIMTEACVGIGIVDVDDIDHLNILGATMLAMVRAAAALKPQADWHLIDGNRCPDALRAQASTIVKGDSKSQSIAAASIIAKVTRDRIMGDLHRLFPVFGWHKNQGYPTKQHRDALMLHGPAPHHRQSFGPVKTIINQRLAS